MIQFGAVHKRFPDGTTAVRALATGPPVPLMDEPFGGAVDPVVRTRLQDELPRRQKDPHVKQHGLAGRSVRTVGGPPYQQGG
ncbi:hypothetical protein BM536_014235 [Streptomyces phaeoluteigriseus]|uniref:Uncharacterized protein n=1 Tax=Streptomyces phaeoluteigriseus TaxID=114686 RepID=A0A1V6MT95_9ACTN|nr:hypothetical protein [Streptomyces phaeoluteigriseus]OQD55669.1 hypothetical protein BM536_014235 [Streptomyces phaeoluteigriseus]